MYKEQTCHLLRNDFRHWERLLAAQVDLLLETRPGTVFPTLAATFEAILIERALIAGLGCRQLAADLLGIGHDSIAFKPTGQSQEVAFAISDEQRNHHVRVAAYYIAQDRDFQGSDPVEDWQQAEQEIRLLVESGHFRD
jgi:hypothetical protein